MVERISGVGKNARRTDKNNSNRTIQGAKEIKSSKYGEGKMLEDIQKQGKMQGTSARVPKLNLTKNLQELSSSSENLPRVTSLFSDTSRPDEPSESGMAFGAGPGSEIISPFANQTKSISQILTQISKYDSTGEVNALLEEALLKGF